MKGLIPSLRDLFSKTVHGASEETLQAQYEASAVNMLEPRLIKELAEVIVFETVLEIGTNEAGRLGMIVAVGWRSRAVHEINRDGTFSKRMPYWTKKDWYSCTPRRFARCLVIGSKTQPNPMRPLHEQIRHIGQAIVEMDTDFRPHRTFEEWRLEFPEHRI